MNTFYYAFCIHGGTSSVIKLLSSWDDGIDSFVEILPCVPEIKFVLSEIASRLGSGSDKGLISETLS